VCKEIIIYRILNFQDILNKLIIKLYLITNLCYKLLLCTLFNKIDLFLREKEIENYILLYTFSFNFKVKIQLFKYTK